MTSEYPVALAAALVAAAAFLVAMLQATLEYISSGSTRYKCTTAAIGGSAKRVRWRWSASDWKLKVSYPLLDINFNDVWRLSVRARELDSCRLQCFDTQLRMDKLKEWSWRSIATSDKITRWHISHGMNVLQGTKRNGNEGLITVFDLDWRGRLSFLKYRLRHWWTPLSVPRASWAQFLLCFGIQDTVDITLPLVDADTVHSSLDAPTQRVSLRHLGILAYTLGFTSVSIDTANRNFTALGPHGAITTEEISTAGKILRFDGNVFEIFRITSRNPSLYLWRASNLIWGRMNFGVYETNGLFWPLQILRDAILESVDDDEYEEKEDKAIRAYCDEFEIGPLVKEGRIFEDYYQSATGFPEVLTRTNSDGLMLPGRFGPRRVNSTNLTAFHELPITRWKEESGSTIPTIYAAATFLTFCPVVCGFPSRKLLLPFLPWLHRRARILRTSTGIRQSKTLRRLTNSDSISFASLSSEFFMDGHDYNPSANGLSGWGITDMQTLLSKCTPEEQEILDPSKHDEGPVAMLSPEVAWLLEDYNIDKWARRIKQSIEESPYVIRPQNLIWVHILVLDIVIQHIVQNGSDFEILPLKKKGGSDQRFDSISQYLRKAGGDGWGMKEAQVVDSIVKAWRPANTEISEKSNQDGAEERTEMELPLSADTSLDTSKDAHLLDIQPQSEVLKVIEECEPDTVKSDPPVPVEITDWPLAKHLKLNSRVLEGETEEIRDAKCTKLAELLEIRALLVIAYLLLHPDSTEVFLSEDFDIEMPMA